MIGIFHALMWYFVFFLYSAQVHGVFGTYEPITYKTGSTLWGVIFIISGILIIKSAKQPDYSLVLWSLVLNIVSFIVSIVAVILTIIELSKFRSVSYRNYGQAKLGREVSRILILSYHLEMSITFVYSLFTCINLYIMSGISTITLDKIHSMNMIACILALNIMSTIIASIGVFLLIVELMVYTFSSVKVIWPQYIISGIFAVEAEKKRTQCLVSQNVSD
ncbi:membrane-spanning 4-domains subfamily A member 13 [Echinops telfairi]|uniref:Membrane-spanning 4-domains subfamily A member 13 n=1 Tax=Echinops telfairi TaxID=9371 RepID=A0ABM0ZTD4_ECHTE|nr:membrane-spanning 4-domains subfamily A member 13 [Echinops telfairi]